MERKKRKITQGKQKEWKKKKKKKRFAIVSAHENQIIFLYRIKNFEEFTAVKGKFSRRSKYLYT